mmetsp:Transcript_2023/g.6134  ORF Transcript_2023/g.6134 Transcript_2023/m.6134 type:complete len:242 (-) Transcript_2023:1654-2379(-)
MGSGEVAVGVRSVGVALEVLAVDEGLDAALDELWVGTEEGELGEDLGEELLVGEGFACLHDPDDGGLDGDGAVLLDALGVVALVEIGHGDADLAHLAGEGGVDDEGVGVLDGVCGGRLGEELVLAAGERVEDALEVVVWQVDAGAHLLVVDGLVVGAVEGEEDDGLERRDLKVVRLFGVGRRFPRGLDGRVAERVHPRQAALRVLLVVVVLEDARTRDDFGGEVGVDGGKGRPVAGGEDLD